MSYIQLNTKNKGLARLATLQSDDWISITSEKLPKTLRNQLNLFYSILTESEMEDDTVVIRVSFDRDTKLYNRCYPPAIYANEEGQTVIVWGNKKIPLTPELLDLLEVEVEEVELERYTERCLVLSIDNEDYGYISLPLQIKMTSETRDVETKRLKKLIKDGKLDQFASFLYIKEDKEPTSYAPTYKFTELPELTELNIIDSRKLEFSTHHNYILSVLYDGIEEAVQCWAPSDIKIALDAGAEIDPERTNFVYITKEGKNGKTRSIVTVNDLVWVEDEEMVRL